MQVKQDAPDVPGAFPNDLLNDCFQRAMHELKEIQGLMQDNPRSNILRPDIIKRFLSFCLTDDERAELLGLPEGCRIRENAKIICPEKLVCGSYVWIGEGAILDASGGLEIGNHSTIGNYVLVWTHSAYLANVRMANIIGSSLIDRKPTRIGNGCLVAGHSVIYRGVNIADQTVVLPMSVVTRNIDEPGSIVGGAPARKIRALSAHELAEVSAAK